MKKSWRQPISQNLIRQIASHACGWKLGGRSYIFASFIFNLEDNMAGATHQIQIRHILVDKKRWRIY